MGETKEALLWVGVGDVEVVVHTGGCCARGRDRDVNGEWGECWKLYRGEEWLEGKEKTGGGWCGVVGAGWVARQRRLDRELCGGGDIGWRDMGGGGGGSTKEYIGKRANRRP